MSGTLEPMYGPLPSDRSEHCHSLHNVELVLEMEERRGEISHFKVGDIQLREIRPRLALAAAQTQRCILMCAGSFCVLLLKRNHSILLLYVDRCLRRQSPPPRGRLTKQAALIKDTAACLSPGCRRNAFLTGHKNTWLKMLPFLVHCRVTLRGGGREEASL